MFDPLLQEKIDSYLAMWAVSAPASRVDQVEGFAINHGFEQYEGQTIPDLITFIIGDLLIFAAQNPELLKPLGETDEIRVNRFLQDEQLKLDEAGRLLKEMHSYFFGILDPRYVRASKKYREVVSSFRSVNEI